jgi:signal peptidase II
VLLNNAPLDAPTPWFHGQVIDMLFFPILEFQWPEWLPLVGGNDFLFFSPVFNIADSSIFIGVVTILIMQKRFFKDKSSESDNEDQQTTTIEITPPAEEPTITPPSENTSSTA